MTDKGRATPRTDRYYEGRTAIRDDKEFARQLECELAEARDELRHSKYCYESVKAELAQAADALSALERREWMVHAGWRYQNLKTGCEILTHQPPDRVSGRSDYECTELFAAAPISPEREQGSQPNDAEKGE